MKWLCFGLTAFSATMSVMMIAPAASAQTLQSVLQTVHDTNPSIRAERSRLRATQEGSKQAWASALPQITSSAAYSRVEESQTVNSALFGPAGTSTQDFTLDTQTVNVTGEQVIFDGLRNVNSIRSARARVRAGEAQLLALEQDTLLAAATAFFDVQRDMIIFDATSANVDVLLERQREANIRFKFGEITKTDVLQADARLEGARAELAGVRTQLALSRAAFKQVVGDMPGELEIDAALPVIPDNEETAQSFAAAAAPSILAAEHAEEASRKQIAVENASFSPQVSLTAQYNYAEEPSSFIVNDEQVIYGVRATVPLFQGGLRLSRRREAKALNASDKSQIIAAERNVESQVTAAWRQTLEARIRIYSATAQVAANTSALEGVRRESQLGSRTTLDVLNAELELLNSNVSLASARRDEQVSAYQLLSVMGALGPEGSLFEANTN